MGMTQKLRKEAEDRWPNLKTFLEGYLNEDWPAFDGTPDKAVDRAITETPTDQLKLVTAEWWDWNARSARAPSLERQISEGLGVNVNFKTQAEATEFMNAIYDKLIVAIRKEEKGWKP